MRIQRDEIRLIMPDGRDVPLASQQQFVRDMWRVQRLLQNASVSRHGIGGYFKGGDGTALKFFALPFEGTARTSVDVDQWRIGWGDLFFVSPTGLWDSGRTASSFDTKTFKSRCRFGWISPSRCGPYIFTLGPLFAPYEVYRARDTKLDRDVALTVLPQAFTDDPERLCPIPRRFWPSERLSTPKGGSYSCADPQSRLALEAARTRRARCQAAGSGRRRPVPHLPSLARFPLVRSR